MNAQELTESDPWSKLFQKGAILWRSCSIGRTTLGDYFATPNEVTFDITPKNSYLGRIAICGATGLWEPEVLSNKIDDKHFTRGVAVFVNEIPPKHWTHLTITGVSKIFHEKGKPERGGCVFAKVEMPYEMECYKNFRLSMFHAQTPELNADIERAVEISDTTWVTCSKVGDTRMIVKPAWVDGVHFHFSTIVKS